MLQYCNIVYSYCYVTHLGEGADIKMCFTPKNAFYSMMTEQKLLCKPNVLLSINQHVPWLSK